MISKTVKCSFAILTSLLICSFGANVILGVAYYSCEISGQQMVQEQNVETFVEDTRSVQEMIQEKKMFEKSKADKKLDEIKPNRVQKITHIKFLFFLHQFFLHQKISFFFTPNFRKI